MSSSSASSVHVVSYCNDKLHDLSFINNFQSTRNEKRKISMIKHWERKRTTSFIRYSKHRLAKANNGSKKKRIKLLDLSLLKCRKHRRQPCILLKRSTLNNYTNVIDDGNKIKNHKNKWLETHIWSSKRMIMSKNDKNTWGVNLPLRNNGGGMKKALRTIQNGCVFNDISYIQPLEIKADSFECIKEILSFFLDPLCPFMQEDFNILPCREIVTLMYSKGKFPRSCLGPVTIFCLPTHTSSSQVWLWAHPAIKFELHNQINNEILMKIQMEECDNNINSISLSQINNSNSDLIRLSVRGSTSIPVIMQTILPLSSAANDTGVTENENDVYLSSIMQSESVHTVWKDGLMLAVNAKDGRLTPTIQSELRNSSSNSQRNLNNDIKWSNKKVNVFKWPNSNSVAHSKLLSEEGRLEASKAYVPDHIVNLSKSTRKQLKYSLSTNENADAESFIEKSFNSSSNVNSSLSTLEVSNLHNFPIFLVRKDMKEINESYRSSRSGVKRISKKNQSCFSGWDIIAPANWGVYLSKALENAGARVIGLEEMEQIQVHVGMTSFPRDFPDTVAGHFYWKNKMKSLNNLALKRPPRKRNLSSLYKMPYLWYNLHSGVESNNDGDDDGEDDDENNEDIDELVVVREESYLRSFDPFSSFFTERLIPQELPNLPFTTFVTISIFPTGRGLPKTGARIIIPNIEDYKKWLFHHQNRSHQTLDLSGSRRLGEWRGRFKLEIEAVDNVNDPSSDEIIRNSIGCITSGLEITGFDFSRSIGLCNLTQIYQLFRNAAQLLNDCEISKSDALSVYALVLFNNPKSNWLRPAMIDILSFK